MLQNLTQDLEAGRILWPW